MVRSPDQHFYVRDRLHIGCEVPQRRGCCGVALSGVGVQHQRREHVWTRKRTAFEVRGLACISGSIAVIATAALTALSIIFRAESAAAGPTPEEYIAHVGGDAKIVEPGELKLDGHRMTCGQRPTVMDNQLDDYGAAYPGFLILNPRLMTRVPTVVKKWIFAHECGINSGGRTRQPPIVSRSKGAAPGLARRDGLDTLQVHQPGQGDSMHFSGSLRARFMRSACRSSIRCEQRSCKSRPGRSRPDIGAWLGHIIIRANGETGEVTSSVPMTRTAASLVGGGLACLCWRELGRMRVGSLFRSVVQSQPFPHGRPRRGSSAVTLANERIPIGLVAFSVSGRRSPRDVGIGSGLGRCGVVIRGPCAPARPMSPGRESVWSASDAAPRTIMRS